MSLGSTLRIAAIGGLAVAAAACGDSSRVLAAIEPVADRLPAATDAPTAAWVAGVNAAGWNFHRHLQGNAVSSPLSIGMAFSLARAGASADTAETLDQIFGFPEHASHSAANAVDLALGEASAASNTVEVASRLFPDHEFAPLPEFLNTAALHYGATLQPVDTADGETAAAAVNDWVSERTRDLIPAMVDAATIQGQQLTLVNTVYLQADWQEPFLADLTNDGEFTTDAGQTVTVPFMRDHEPLDRRYVVTDNADAVELPYAGGELAMWLVVPHERDGLEAVEEALDAAAVAGLSDVAQHGSVQLTMPKWTQELPAADIFSWLCPLGLCPGAGFDGIAPGIFITSAVHGAKVVVDEAGTEAAAATGMTFDESAPPPPSLTVVADRPFLWAIVHREMRAVIFVGRLVNPAA
ncbi:serpin family protein [Candidatus Poriferisodalis sp.]|uniref:serpin family protein n=1 Tax=Candidatus Poriferisodalis sp. TaxID=3101277 RepID=UPI003B019FCE